jgi:hypothetical protein
MDAAGEFILHVAGLEVHAGPLARAARFALRFAVTCLAMAALLRNLLCLLISSP